MVHLSAKILSEVGINYMSVTPCKHILNPLQNIFTTQI